jgi:hypothetical protein
MMTFIKNNFIKLFLIYLLIVWMGLNCLGFCFDKMRALSDDEKIRIAVSDILNLYGRKADYERIPGGQVIKSKRWIFGPGIKLKLGASDSETNEFPAYPIPYRDVDEFLTLNPGCCYVTNQYHSIHNDEHGDAVDYFCFFGGKSAIVVVNYIFKYKDKNGLLQHEFFTRYVGMNNCGKFIYNV